MTPTQGDTGGMLHYPVEHIEDVVWTCAGVYEAIPLLCSDSHIYQGQNTIAVFGGVSPNDMSGGTDPLSCKCSPCTISGLLSYSHLHYCSMATCIHFPRQFPLKARAAYF